MTEKRRGPGADYELNCLRDAYQRACETIADMHAAAVGERRAPTHGAVQDVVAAREADRQAICELGELIASVSWERAEISRKLVENQAFYEKRINALLSAMRDAGVEDDHFRALTEEAAGE
jgi:hypothetical protein